MPPARAGLGREVGVDVEERRTRNVPGEVQLPPTRRIAELPPAVDELVARRPGRRLASARRLEPGQAGDLAALAAEDHDRSADLARRVCGQVVFLPAPRAPERPDVLPFDPPAVRVAAL